MLKNIKTILKNSAIYSTGSSAAKLVGFILIPIYTKYLSIEDFGILGLVEVTSQILIGVFGLALYRAFIRWYWDPEVRTKQKSIFFTALITSFGLAIIMLVIIWTFSSQIAYSLFGDSSYQYLINLMALTSAAQIISQVILSLMRVQEKPVLYSISNIIKIIITLSLTIYFIVYLGKGVEGIYEAQIIGFIVFFLFLIKYVINNSQPIFEYRVLQAMLIYSYPLIFSSLFGILISVVDRYFLKFMSGLGDVGIYTFGYKISNVLKILLITPFQLAVTPLIYKMMDDSQSERFYSKMMTYSGFIIIFFALMISMFSNDFVVLLARDTEYWAASKIIPILSLSLAFDMFRIVALIGLNISKRTKIISMIIIVISILNILLNIVLIPIWQYVGAAIANLFSHIIFFLLIYYFSQKHYPLPFEILKILKIVIVGIMLYLLSLMTLYLNYSAGIVMRILMLFSYPLLLYMWNFYEEIEINQAKIVVKRLLRLTRGK